MGMVHRLRQDQVTWRAVEDEGIALDLRRSEYLSLNPTAQRLWAALEVGASTSELEAILLAAGADEDQAHADVEEFLAALRQRELLHEGP